MFILPCDARGNTCGLGRQLVEEVQVEDGVTAEEFGDDDEEEEEEEGGEEESG